jgi:predicted nucleotidyltransferase
MRETAMRHPPLGILKTIFEKYPEVQAVYLFGSIASGRANAGSELDLAVLTDDTRLRGRKLDILAELARKGFCNVDVVYPGPHRNEMICQGTSPKLRGRKLDILAELARKGFCNVDVVYPGPHRSEMICQGTSPRLLESSNGESAPQSFLKQPVPKSAPCSYGILRVRSGGGSVFSFGDPFNGRPQIFSNKLFYFQSGAIDFHIPAMADGQHKNDHLVLADLVNHTIVSDAKLSKTGKISCQRSSK